MVVLDYLHSSLANQSPHSTPGEFLNQYRMKGQMERLNTTLAICDGFQPIKLLESLLSLNEAFDAFGQSEAVEVRELAFFLA